MEVDDFATLMSSAVRSETGTLIGEIAAVHVDEGTEHVRFIEIEQQQRDLHYVVPVAGAVVADDMLVVPYTLEDIERGPLVEADQTLSVGEINIVVRYYNTGQVDFHGRPITDRSRAAVEPVTAKKKRFNRKTLPPLLPIMLPDTEVAP